MARKSLVGEVADDLLDRIVAGEFPPGALVPGELELSAQHEVSRMTVREAMKTLEAQRILSVQRGRGTFVNAVDQWNSLEALLRAASAHVGNELAGIQLIELRRMLETGACALAAPRITEADLARLRGFLADMRDAHDRGDVDEFVGADLAFHDVILEASGNVFLTAVFQPLHRMLAARRKETSRVPDIQEHALGMHAAVLAALESRDAKAASEAMDAHMTQTLDDLVNYVQ
ncbi:FadR/GntR family transcriptional regulator [Sinomonas sp. JGH33]|uniref:FadR/GntR family transcriptional regulator n=1 Tax=Sinomonas terricola TaxID=3110330 RepID=A0ABU5T8Y4_9MICC|nr:FadR/GntR family transcriptional regulator [Sinomonas sp. JGH33]MEA5456153.1 FadR/GntR family transcriptional regulator [Sinomonas sp. JGH33]